MNRALLVIDPQKIYTSEDSEMYCDDATATIERINSLINKFVKEQALIIFIRHVHKSDGSDLGRMFDFAGDSDEDFNFKEGSDEVEYDKRLIIPSDTTHFVKNRYSAFVQTDLLEHLRRHKIDRVIICGFMTNFCCESTARDAHDYDFYVDFVIDATGTPGIENLEERDVRKIVGELLSEGFARVLTSKEVLDIAFDNA